MTTTPPAITSLPAAPDPNNRATFNTLAYPWSAALPAFGTQVSAVGANVKANADEANADAVATAADRVQTGLDKVSTAADRVQTVADRVQTGLDRVSATSSASTATAKAGEANASAIAAAASVASIAGGPVASVNGMTGVVTGIATTANITSERTAAATLTNKTISAATNTVEASSLKSATTTVSIFSASAPTTGQILTATSGTAATWQNPSAGGVGDHAITVHSGNGIGSTSTRIRRFTTTQSSVGTAITYADSATLGGSFTINESGLYAITYTDGGSAGGRRFGVSLNTTTPSTEVQSIASSQRLVATTATNDSTPNFGSCATVARLSSGDVLRPHIGNNNPDEYSPIASITVRKVGA